MFLVLLVRNRKINFKLLFVIFSVKVQRLFEEKLEIDFEVLVTSQLITSNYV